MKTEPRMEDLLASIRRIMADEDVNAAAGLGSAQARSRLAEEAGAALSEPELDEHARFDPDQLPELVERSILDAFSGELGQGDDEPPHRPSARDRSGSGAPKPDRRDAAGAGGLDASPAVHRGEGIAGKKPADESAAARDPVRNLFRSSGGQKGAAGKPDPAPDMLLSDRAETSINAAFESLSRTILSSNPRTLEDLIREMLRPMLRDWLDSHLPDLVERMVRQEIDRVTLRRR